MPMDGSKARQGNLQGVDGRARRGTKGTLGRYIPCLVQHLSQHLTQASGYLSGGQKPAVFFCAFH